MKHLNELKFDTDSNTAITILNYHFQYSIAGNNNNFNSLNTNEFELLSGHKSGYEVDFDYGDENSKKFKVLENEYTFEDRKSMSVVMQDLKQCKKNIYAENDGLNCVKYAIIENFSLTNGHLKNAIGEGKMYVSDQINQIFKEVIGIDLLTQEGFSNDLKVKDKITHLVANEIRNSSVYEEAVSTIKMLDSKSENINEIFLNGFTEKQRESLKGADIQSLARKMRLEGQSVDDFIKEIPVSHQNIKTAVKLKEKQNIKELPKPKI
ncbi:TPA: hypothetical protein NHK58_001422 [Pseudomonas aeruginosa]|nr:hypothetical protein [Pseudomonas aeruginosa]